MILEAVTMHSFFAVLCVSVYLCCNMLYLVFLLLLVFFLVHKASSVSSLRLAESTSAMATEDRPQHDLCQRPSPESRWELALHRRRDNQRRSEIGERKTSILQCRDDHYIHHTYLHSDMLIYVIFQRFTMIWTWYELCAHHVICLTYA